MKALILKDYYNIKKQGKFILGVTILYGIIGMFISGSFLAPFLGILCLILPINTFSFDKYSKWDNYALTLPVTRTQLALSKYVVGFALVLSAIIINILFYGASFLLPDSQPLPPEVFLLTCYSILCASSLAFSILFPFIFKFGIEKSRIVLIVIFLIPSLSIALFPTLGSTLNHQLSFFAQLSFPTILFMLSILIVIILTISMVISIKILKKKDF